MDQKYVPIVFMRKPGKTATSMNPDTFLVGSIKAPVSSPEEAERQAREWLKGIGVEVGADAVPGRVTLSVAAKGLARGYVRYYPGVQE